MYTNRTIASLAALLVVTTTVAPAVGATSQSKAYTGTHVSFDVADDAVVDYAVGSETVFESMTVQSQSEAEGSDTIGIGTDLSAVTNFPGAAVSLDARAETSATITADSGATIRAHDNPRGSFVVDAGGEPQYVAVNVSEAARVRSQGDGHVVVTADNGTEGTFVVVGDGSVAVNDDGNVTAELGAGSSLVFRAYPDGRDAGDERQEQLIANGTAAAEVYVMQKAEGSADAVADVVNYGQNTTVEVTRQGEGTVTMTVERSKHEGKVVITSVSESVVGSTDDLRVTVDGQAAVEASSYGDLRDAIGSDQSEYLIRRRSGARAGAEVLVAINHFSERTVEMTSRESTGGEATSTVTGDDSDGESGATPTDSTGAESTAEPSDGTQGEDDASTPGQPGFGAGVALIALAVAALLAPRRR